MRVRESRTNHEPNINSIKLSNPNYVKLRTPTYPSSFTVRLLSMGVRSSEGGPREAVWKERIEHIITDQFKLITQSSCHNSIIPNF